MKIYKTDKNDPQRIPLKLHEDNEYEYLDTENPYKSHDDSTTSTVGKIEGDSSDTKSPIDTTAVRNQYWMDQSLGGGRAYSMMTTKKKLGESVDVLKFLTERDVLVMSSQEVKSKSVHTVMAKIPMIFPERSLFFIIFPYFVRYGGP